MRYQRLFVLGLIGVASSFSSVALFIADQAQAKEDHSTAEMFDIFGKVANEDQHSDTKLSETVFYSGLADRWIKAYLHGKPGEAEKIWSQILKQIKDSPTCYVLVKKLFDRLAAVAPDNADNNSKYGILPYSKNLLGATEKTLGPNHRFVSDILSFMCTHYDSVKDFKTALGLRRRSLEIQEKASGPEAEMTGFCLLDVAFDLGELGRFEEAKQIADRTLKLAKARKYDRLIGPAMKLDSQLIAAIKKRSPR